MSRGVHPLLVVALAVALIALAVAIATFVSKNFMLRLFWAAMETVLFRGPLRYTYTDHIKDAANQIKVVTALRGKHKRIELCARLTRNRTLETLETQVALILHTTGLARLNYGPQQITEFTYGSVRRGLLIIDIVKATTTNCDCCLNDDIKVAITNLWTTASILSTTPEQVDPDATLIHS